MDYHGSIEAYYDAKSHIARYQDEKDIVIFPQESADCTRMAKLSAGRKIGVTMHDAPVEIEATKLKGQHNLSNIALAWKACEEIGRAHV